MNQDNWKSTTHIVLGEQHTTHIFLKWHVQQCANPSMPAKT